jgi:hypothetical protein
VPLSYRDIRDIYDTEKDLGLVKESLPEWSQRMNTQTSSTEYSEGLRDNWWRRWSTAADKNFFEPIGSVTSEPIGRQIGGIFGGEKGEEIGARIGRSLPRTLTQTVPVIAATALSGGSAAIPFIGAAATGGLFGAQTLAETGSAPAALVSGGVAAALPSIGGVGEKIAARTFGETFLPKFIGSQVAQTTALQAQGLAESAILGQPYDPMSAEFWSQQIPFTVYDLVARTVAKPVPAPVAGAAKVTPPTPKYEPRVHTAEEDANIEAMLAKVTDAYTSPTASQVDKEGALAAAGALVQDPTKIIKSSRSGKVEPMVSVTGWIKPNENGNLKMLVKSAQGYDVSEVHGNVWLNDNADATLEQNPDGTVTVTTPKRFVSSNVTSPLTHKSFGLDPDNLELKVQPKNLKVGLAPDERQVLETSGVPFAETEEAALKSTAQNIEDAETSIVSTREEIKKVPERPEEVHSILVTPGKTVEDVKPVIKKALDEGLTPTQAVEKARLIEQTPQLDLSISELETQKERARRIAAGVKFGGGKASTLLDSKGRRLGTPGSELVFGGEVDAQTFLDEYEKSYPHLDMRVTSRVLKGKRQWFIRVEGLKTTPLIEDEVDVAAPPVDLRPAVSKYDVLRKLDVAERVPETFAQYYNEDLVPDEPIDAVRKARITLQLGEQGLEKVNAALRAADLLPFKDMNDMRTQMTELMEAADSFNKKYTNFSMGSKFPVFNPEIATRVGVFRNGQLLEDGFPAFLEWFVNWKESGFAGKLVDAVRKAYDTSPIKLKFDAGDKMSYSHIDRDINVDWLPASEEELGRWALDMVHEFGHDTIRELLKRTDPAAMQFRATLIESIEALKKSPLIPPEIRSKLHHSSEMTKRLYGSGTVSDYLKRYIELTGDKKGEWVHIFYGLSNEDEFVAQMFGSPKMVGLMARTPMPRRPVSILQFLSSVWNNYFGGRTDTDNVLAQVLSHYDNYLAGKRIRPTKEGIVASPQQPYSGYNFIRDSLVATGVRPEALTNRIHDIVEYFNTGDMTHLLNGYQRDSDANVLPATEMGGEIHPEITKALTTGTVQDVAARTVNLLMADVSMHSDLLARLKQDVGIATKLYTNIQQGLVPGELPPNAFGFIRTAQSKLAAMSRSLDRQGRDITRYNDLSNFTISGMERTLAGRLTSDRLPAPPDPTSMAAKARAALGLEEYEPSERTKVSRAELDEGRATRFFKGVRRWGMFTQYLKGLIPEIRPAFDHISQNQGESNLRMNELNVVRNTDPVTKEVSPVIEEANRRVFANNTLRRVASDILLYRREASKRGWPTELSAPYIRGRLATLNGPDQTTVTTYLNSVLHVHDHYVENTTAQKYLPKINLLDTARVIVGLEPGMRVAVGEDLAKTMHDALNLLPQNPALGQQMLKQLSTKMSGDTFLKALEFSRNVLAASQKHIEFMRANKYYVSEQRLDGKYGLRMITVNNEPFFQTYPSQEAAQKRAKELERLGYKFLEFVPKSDAHLVGGLTDAFLNSVRELDQQRSNQLEAAFKDKPEVLEAILPAVQRARDYEASRMSFAAVPGAGFPGIRFIAGREEMDMVQNEYLSYLKFNNWMHHQLTRSQSRLDLLEPELMANRAATKIVQQHVDNFLKPDNQIARALSEITFNWKLAFNFGVNFLHGIQGYTTGMTSLISETGGVGDAFKYTTRAQKAILQRVTSGKWESDDLRWLANISSGEGIRGFASWDSDIGDKTRESVLNANTPPWIKPVEKLKWAARSWNGMFFKYNDTLGLVAAFMLGRERGMDHVEAYQFAKDAKERGYFTPGKAGRPVGQWSAATRAVPQLMSSLQSYVQSWFSLLAYNYIRGFGRAPADLTRAQIVGAKKAFLYQLGAQAVLGGALGLPGVGQGMALTKQFTGIDVMGWLHQHLSDLFNEDQDGGGMMTTLALHGPVAAFTPVDPSGRHMPSIPYIGVSPYKGFDIAQLAGAPVSGVSDFVKGLMAAAKGDLEGASKILPTALTGPFELFRGDGAEVRDRAGHLITTMTPAESFITALGMKPSRVTQLKDVNTAAKEASTRATKEKSDQIVKIARTFTTNPADARTQLLQYAQANPQEDYATLTSSVAHHVADMTIPYDYRRHVNAGADLIGLGTRQPSSEVQRRQMIYQTQLSLGALPRPNPAADREAQDIDELLDSNPSMTRQQAVKATRHIKRRRSALVEPNGY